VHASIWNFSGPNPLADPSDRIRKKKKKKKHTGPLGRAIRRLGDALVAIGAPALAWCVVRIPPHRRMALARILGRIMARVIPIRSGVVDEQLHLAFSEMSPSERKQLLPRIYAHLVAFGLEILAMRDLDTSKLGETLISRVEELKDLFKLKESKQGFLMVTAHIGNWEWAGAYIVSVGVDLAAVAKPMHSEASEKFIQQTRERHGVKIIYTNENHRRLVSHLRKGGCLALVADQDARGRGIFVDFFGRPASTAPGPGWLSYKLGVPIIPIWGFRTDQGLLRYETDPPMWPNQDAPEEEEIRRLTQYHVSCLENAIRRDPAQYFWVHKRWKTKEKKKLEA